MHKAAPKAAVQEEAAAEQVPAGKVPTEQVPAEMLPAEMAVQGADFLIKKSMFFLSPVFPITEASCIMKSRGREVPGLE